MLRFPVAVSTVRPLYFPPPNSIPVSNYTSRGIRNMDFSLLSCSAEIVLGKCIFKEKKSRTDEHPFCLKTPDSLSLTFNYRSAVKVLQTKMYEPISDSAGNVITPRYSIGNDAFQQSDNEEEEEQSERAHQKHVQMTICDNKKIRSGMGDNCIDVDHINLERNFKNKLTSVAVQTSHLSPYRLRFWPQGASNNLKCMDGGFFGIIKCCLKTLSQWFLSQVGLTLILILWTLLGAFAFYKTEGPREKLQIEEINQLKHEITIDLSTDLRQTSEHDLMWSKIIEKYLLKYDSMILKAISGGYGEGAGGYIWTYPGSILFAVSLLTTLGFGAPVPRSSLARGATVLFSAIGIPLHFLLIVNIGTMAVAGLTSLTTASNEKPSNSIDLKKGKLRWFPFIAVILYYILGIICFGFIRKLTVVESLMFPLNFTAAGGVAKTLGHVRILYALYLEVAVILATMVVTMIRVSASNSVIDLGIKLGLVTNT